MRNLAEGQGEDMKASIAEAARSATAMRDVAIAVGANAKAAETSVALFKDANARQMRAYLIVSLGGVIKQDPATNYRFEVRMNLQNVGNTPAYKVAHVTRADVLPFPIPTDFQFPTLSEATVSASVGPHQGFSVTGIASRIYPDDDVAEIATGTKKRLYVYGTIRYEDVFGASHQTNFSHAILWLKNDTFMTLNTPVHNDSD